MVGQLMFNNNSSSQRSNFADSGLAGSCRLASVEVIHLDIPGFPVEGHILIELELVTRLSVGDQLTCLMFVIETDKMALLVELGNDEVVVQNKLMAL